MTLRFSDGMEFDTSGPLRVIHRKDGYYVTGKGLLMACDTREDGERIIREMQQNDEKGGQE